MFLGEHQRRPNLEDVVLGSGGSDQDSVFSHGVDNAVHHIGGIFSTDSDPGELATPPLHLRLPDDRRRGSHRDKGGVVVGIQEFGPIGLGYPDAAG